MYKRTLTASKVSNKHVNHVYCKLGLFYRVQVTQRFVAKICCSCPNIIFYSFLGIGCIYVHHLHKLQIWPPGCVTCHIALDCLGSLISIEVRMKLSNTQYSNCFMVLIVLCIHTFTMVIRHSVIGNVSNFLRRILHL